MLFYAFLLSKMNNNNFDSFKIIALNVSTTHNHNILHPCIDRTSSYVAITSGWRMHVFSDKLKIQLKHCFDGDHCRWRGTLISIRNVEPFICLVLFWRKQGIESLVDIHFHLIFVNKYYSNSNIYCASETWTYVRIDWNSIFSEAKHT